MATKFGIKQANVSTPAWVIKAAAGVTIALQMLPQVIDNSTVLQPHTKEVIGLVCDIVNIVLVAFAPLFGESQSISTTDKK